MAAGFIACTESWDPASVFVAYADGTEPAVRAYSSPGQEAGHQDGKLKINGVIYDAVYDIGDGLRRVEIGGKENCVDADGRPMFSQWFDRIDVFIGGISRVTMDGKDNFIRKNGALLSSQWFDGASRFHGDFAIVELNGKRNIIGKSGHLLSKEWLDDVEFTQDGNEPIDSIADVTLGERHGIIGLDGTITWIRN